MARTLEFDYDKAIDKATRVFWKQGYPGTSLRDLLKAIGIGEGSFYNTLKSKKQIFLQCLKHYKETVSRRHAEVLLSPTSAKEGVRALFKAVLDDLDDPRTPCVCLLARSVSSDVLEDRDLQKYIRTDMGAFGGAFVNRLKSAKDAGELPSDFDADAVAQIIFTYLQGLYRTALLNYDRPQLEHQVDLLLMSLGL
jgi:TetR/AcrR family transcriptional repressor of nem operon